jgi:hypothetical protein
MIDLKDTLSSIDKYAIIGCSTLSDIKQPVSEYLVETAIWEGQKNILFFCPSIQEISFFIKPLSDLAREIGYDYTYYYLEKRYEDCDSSIQFIDCSDFFDFDIQEEVDEAHLFLLETITPNFLKKIYISSKKTIIYSHANRIAREMAFVEDPNFYFFPPPKTPDNINALGKDERAMILGDFRARLTNLPDE